MFLIIYKHNILGVVIKISSEHNIKTYKKNTKNLIL